MPFDQHMYSKKKVRRFLSQFMKSHEGLAPENSYLHRSVGPRHRSILVVVVVLRMTRGSLTLSWRCGN